MFKALSPGAIGVNAVTLADSVAAARAGGFAGVEFSAAVLADFIDSHGLPAAQAIFRSAKIRPAAFMLPTDWRGADDTFKRDLEALPRLAGAAVAIGCTRCATWIMPGSNDLQLTDNRHFHVDRFRPIARALSVHGICIGLEFIGPKTLRETFKHPFIYRMGDMLNMAREIGPNVGLLLDSYHVYTAGHTLDEVRQLKAREVVYVHINDAPAGLTPDQQFDTVRCLPGETGVIDITGFLRALKQIGYEGPVTPEPFKKELAELADDEARLKVVGEAMEKVFAGL